MAAKNPIIEHAKRMLMDKYGLDEPEAHRFIGSTSMELRVPRLVIAKRIIRQLGGSLSDV